MQWFKSAMVVSSAVFVAAMAANGCSSSPGNGGDAGGDVKITPSDGSTKDVKTSTDSATCTPTSGLSCEQCNVSGFSPQPQGTPIGPNAGKCQTSDITAFDTACVATGATQQTCQAWEQNATYATCAACVVTDQTAANWGPLVCTQSGCSYNIPGCVDLGLGQKAQENSTSSGSCGDLLNADYQCQDYACDACGTLPDGGADSTDFDTCLGTNSTTAGALNNECASYNNAFEQSSECSALGGDSIPTSVQTCFPSDPNNGFSEQEFIAFVTYFCGPT